VGDVPVWPGDAPADERAGRTGGDSPGGDPGDDLSALLFEPAMPPVAEPAPAEPPRTEPPRTAPPVAAEEHFVPPEPPPLPRLGPPALVGLTLIALGLVLIVSPGWVGVPTPYGLPLGLLGLACGLGWLVLRLWPDPPSDGEVDADDDGAVL
jgi:hypothetical protein